MTKFEAMVFNTIEHLSLRVYLAKLFFPERNFEQAYFDRESHAIESGEKAQENDW